MKISKLNLLMTMYLLVLLGICNASSNNDKHNKDHGLQDKGAYQADNLGHIAIADATPEQLYGQDFGEDDYRDVDQMQANYEANRDKANNVHDTLATQTTVVGADSDVSSNNDFSTGIESASDFVTNVEKSLKHTSRVEDEQHLESIAETIERELKMAMKYLDDILEPELKKLQGFLSADNPIQEYNKQFTWRRWNRVKNIDQIKDMITQKQQEIAQQKEHILEIINFGFELAQREQQKLQSDLKDINTYLKSSDPVAEYNKQSYFFQFGHKISMVDQLKEIKSKLESDIKFWDDYLDSLKKIAWKKFGQKWKVTDIFKPYQQAGYASHKLDRAQLTPKKNISKKVKFNVPEEKSVIKIGSDTYKKEVLTPEEANDLLTWWNNTSPLLYGAE